MTKRELNYRNAAQELNDILQEEAKKLLPDVKVTLRYEPPVYGICNIVPEGSYKHEFKYKNHNCVYEDETIKDLDREQLVKEIVEPAVKVLKTMEMKSCLKLELTGKELGAIYKWMSCADDCGVDTYTTDDEDIRALVKKIQNKYDCYTKLKTTNNERTKD